MSHIRAVISVHLALGCLLLSTCLARPAQPDTTSTTQTRLTLTDGSELIGTIVMEDSATIEFKTVGNISMTVPQSQVKTRERISGEIISGEYRRFDPNHTRLLLSPTARSLKAGQGYFATTQLFFPFLSIGLADFISIGGGVSLFPTTEAQLVYVAPKIRVIHLDRFDLSGGVLYINSTIDGIGGFGVFYGVGTYGTSSAALTLGLGWGFAGDEVADEPIILIGGEARLSNSVKLITENWIPPESGVKFLSLGIRFFGDNLAADIGLIFPVTEYSNYIPFFPWLGFAYNFGTGS